MIVSLPAHRHLFAQEEHGLRLQPGLVTRDGHLPYTPKDESWDESTYLATRRNDYKTSY